MPSTGKMGIIKNLKQYNFHFPAVAFDLPACFSFSFFKHSVLNTFKIYCVLLKLARLTLQRWEGRQREFAYVSFDSVDFSAYQNFSETFF